MYLKKKLHHIRIVQTKEYSRSKYTFLEGTGRFSAVITPKIEDFVSPVWTWVEVLSRAVILSHVAVESKKMPLTCD